MSDGRQRSAAGRIAEGREVLSRLLDRPGPDAAVRADALVAVAEIWREKSAEEIDEELAREIAKLRSRAMQDLFSRLKQNQQVRLSKILGDEFHYQELPKEKRRQAGSSKPASTANGK